MPKSYFTIYEGAEGRYEEKKSVFLCDGGSVRSEEEALAFLEEVRKRHYDARHHCFAYRIGTEGVKVRSSDDGEPSGTAGKPILDVIAGADLSNAILVVTRYFGGTLLGTGGLVRAYTAAARDCLEKSTLVQKTYGSLLDLRMNYGELGKIQYYLAQEKIQTLSADYTDAVDLKIIIPDDKEEQTEKKIIEMTAGRVRPERLRKAWYQEIGGKVQIDGDS